MTSLFSSFDCNLFFKSFLISFIFLVFFLSSSFVLESKSNILAMLVKILGKFFVSLKPKMFPKVFLLILFTFFVGVFSFNFLSVHSFNFPVTSHFGGVMALSLSFWSSLVLFASVHSPKSFFLHFVPEGAPMGLVPFLYVIETVSNLIRFLTLSVRLVANILAGHLLMILLSKLVFNYAPLFFSFMALNVVEILVSVIQAYIFSTMAVLYFSELH